MCAPCAELHYRSALRSPDNSVCLGGNKRLMIDIKQKQSFYKKQLGNRSADRNDRLFRENRRPFRYCPYVAGKPEIFKIL